MKLAVCIFLVGVSAVLAKQVPPSPVFGYHGAVGIPRFEALKKAAEESAQNPSKITGGSSAVEGQFKHQAGLIIDLNGVSGNSVCGASLISANRLLTAAHCWYDGVYQAWRFTVALGTTQLFLGGTRIQTTEVVTHPNWFPLLARDDVAVISLPSNVEFSDTISPISLPSGADLSNSFSGTVGTASGFGLTRDGGSITLQQTLSWINAPIISNTICRLSFPFHVRDTNICISGANGISTCNGDSGGPLAVGDTLVGITSFGSAEGCEVNSPAVFARVTEYVSWINERL